MFQDNGSKGEKMQIEWTLNITDVISSVISAGVAVLIGALITMRYFRRQQHEIWLRDTITQHIAKLQGAFNWYITGIAAGITLKTPEEKEMLNKVAQVANDYFSSAAASALQNLQSSLTPLIFADDLDKFSELNEKVKKISFEGVSKEEFRAKYIIALGRAMINFNIEDIIETLLEPDGVKKLETKKVKFISQNYLKGDFNMTKRFSQLLEKMTLQEQAEVEIFAAFVIASRKFRKPQVLTDDISTQEMMRLIDGSGSFDWLDAEEEDVYSIEDGEAVQWPSES